MAPISFDCTLFNCNNLYVNTGIYYDHSPTYVKFVETEKHRKERISLEFSKRNISNRKVTSQVKPNIGMLPNSLMLKTHLITQMHNR